MATEDLLVRIDATTEQLRRELRQADQQIQRSTRGMERDLSRVDRAVASVNAKFAGFTRTLGGLGIGLGVGALGRFGQQAISSAANIERMSEALGVSGERFQELTFAFEQFGLRRDDVSDALATLADRAQDAVSGTESMVEDFRLLGIEVEQLRGKRPDELFRLFADAVARTEDPGNRVTGVVRNLGDDLGRRLLPLLREGSEGFDDLAREANNAGAVMREDTLTAAQELDREFRQLTSTFGNFFQLLSVEGAAALQNFGEQLGTGFAQLTTGRTMEDELAHLEERLETLRAQRDNMPDADSFWSFAFPNERLDQEIRETEARLRTLRELMAFGSPDTGGGQGSAVQVDPIAVQASRPGLDLDLAQQVVRDHRRRIQRMADQTLMDGLAAPGEGRGMDEMLVDLPEKTASVEELNRRLREIDETNARLTAGFEGFGRITSSALEEAIIRFEDLRSVAQGALRDIQAIATRPITSERCAA